MKQTKIILVSATPLEHGGLKELFGFPIFQVGIGKINAASNMTEILWNEEPDVVINFGSCGNLKQHKIGEVLEVGTVYNNIDCEPFAPYGCTPYLDLCDIKLSNSPIKCFTTDQFYDAHRTDYSKKYLQRIGECDIVDMECYALAQVCKQREILFRSFKWVSDDGESHKWEENAKIGFENFKWKLKQDFFADT